MFAHTVTPFCVTLHILDLFHATASLQLVHVVPPPVGDNSMMVRHNAYIDSKLRQYSFNILNHEGYHVRNMAVSPVLLPTTIDYASNISASALPLGSYMSRPNVSSTVSTEIGLGINGSIIIGTASQAPSNTSFAATKKHSLMNLTNTRLMTKTSTTSNSTQKWDLETDAACSSRLGLQHANISYPAGISACYNVRSLDDKTGTFDVDLRLYRIDTARGDWTHVQGTGMSVGLSYTAATVTLQPNRIGMKRNEASQRSSHLLESSLDIALVARGTMTAPRLLQVLLLTGQVDSRFISNFQIE